MREVKLYESNEKLKYFLLILAEIYILWDIFDLNTLFQFLKGKFKI